MKQETKEEEKKTMVPEAAIYLYPRVGTIFFKMVLFWWNDPNAKEYISVEGISLKSIRKFLPLLTCKPRIYIAHRQNLCQLTGDDFKCYLGHASPQSCASCIQKQQRGD